MRAPAVEVPRARESYCANCAWLRGGSGTGRVGTVVVPLASWSNVGRRSSRALLGAVADRLGMMRRGAGAVRGGSFCACPCPETEYNLGDDGGTYGGSSLRIVGIKRPFLSNMDFTVEVCLCGGTSTSPHINSRALTFSQVGLAGPQVLPSLTKVTTIFGETGACFACKPSVLRFHANTTTHQEILGQRVLNSTMQTPRIALRVKTEVKLHERPLQEKFVFCLTGPYLTRRATIGRL